MPFPLSILYLPIFQSPYTFPITFLTNQFLTILTLAYTTPSSSLRIYIFLFTLITSILFGHTVLAFKPSDKDAEFRAAAVCEMCILMLTNCDLLCLTRVDFGEWKKKLRKEDEHRETGELGKREKGISSGVSFEQYVSSSSKHKIEKENNVTCISKQTQDSHPKETGNENQTKIKDTLWNRLKWSISISVNLRRINTPHQIPHIPPFSTANPSYIPSRSAFLLRTAFLFLFGKYVLFKLGLYGLYASEKYLYLLTRPYLRFFPRMLFASALPISLGETIFRFRQVMCLWLICGSAQFWLYQLLAFAMVGLGIQDPEQWPPYYGNPGDAWSVRQFWGSSWHQSFRQLLTTNTDFLILKIGKFPRKSLITRYTRLTLSFLISGLMHLAMEYQHGFVAGEAGSIRFFVLQAFGIMLEDSVQAIARQAWFPYMSPRVRRVLGYLWVVAWLLETTPVWFYSQSLYLIEKRGRKMVFPVGVGVDGVGVDGVGAIGSVFGMFGGGDGRGNLSAGRG